MQAKNDFTKIPSKDNRISTVRGAVDLSVLSSRELVNLYILFHSRGERRLARPFLDRLLDGNRG